MKLKMTWRDTRAIFAQLAFKSTSIARACIGTGTRALVALVGIAGVTVAVANYTMTQGAGTNFGSVLVGGVHYVQMMLCDLATPGQCASVSAGGAVKVDNSGVTQPVSAVSWPLPTGAATASGVASIVTALGTPFQAGGSIGNTAFGATQSGTWNVTNISGTVSLPTGAATAAKQPALGTAGSASVDVLTVQGIASMTPFLTNPGTAANWGVGTSTQNSATVANGHLALGQFNTSPTTITSGNMSPVQLDNAGNLLVNVKAGGAGGGAVTIASGAVASGAYSAGSIAAGAIVAGAALDGWDVTKGAKADAACGTAAGTCSEIALLKFLNTAVNSPPPLNLNGTNTPWTGLTPGVAQTGTIVAANVDATSKGGVAYGAMTNFGTTPGAVKVDGANVSLFLGTTAPSTGAGASGSGTQRVTPANDTAAGVTPVKSNVPVASVMTPNTVAASATNFVLSSTQGGGTGATGDLLEYCVIQPGTTTPGAFTILDNATTIFSFPGGASSVSNLVPFVIPIGALSASGAWKITTTTNITGTCFGKFT